MGKVEIDYVRIWQPVSTAGCAATFVGTGGDDTNALSNFLNSHAHQNVCLQGTIRAASTVDVSIPAGAETTWNWMPGAKLLCTNPNPEGDPAGAVLRIRNSYDLTINSCDIEGTSYFFEPIGISNGFGETQSGIEIYGGSRITLNDPYVHDTRGDGIYSGTGFGTSEGQAATHLVINRPNMLRNSRNNITPNAGQMEIYGPGTLDYAGLHNIDLEPNSDVDAASINLKVSGLRMTNPSDLTAHDAGGGKITGMTLASCGHVGSMRQLIDVRNCSADAFTLALQNVTTVNLDVSSDTVVNGNTGDVAFEYGISNLNLIRATNLTIAHYPYCA